MSGLNVRCERLLKNLMPNNNAFQQTDVRASKLARPSAAIRKTITELLYSRSAFNASLYGFLKRKSAPGNLRIQATYARVLLIVGHSRSQKYGGSIPSDRRYTYP
jgi:hypothetical protein